MWPYSNDERVWLEPSNAWAEKQAKAKRTAAFPKSANDIDGAWPYITAEQPVEDNRPFDPQIIIRK
jgi:hypothetical protein